MKRTILTAAVMALAAGPARSGGDAAPASRAATAADLLAAADAAATGRDRAARKALGKAVAALDQLGVRAAQDQQDAVAGWRAQAGPAAATGPVYRGRVLGPAYRRGWLGPGAELTIEQLFYGGQSANIAVAATPAQPLRLTVHGADAAAPCGTDPRGCRWTPIFTERYTVRVRNAGAVGARYYLVFD